MKNTFWYRYFLICNGLANKMMGHEPQNFALLIVEENLGRFGNAQMTQYFKLADEFLSDMMSNDRMMMFEELDMDVLAELSIEQIEQDFEQFCQGRLRLKFDNED
jgi:hypothetical protein